MQSTPSFEETPTSGCQIPGLFNTRDCYVKTPTSILSLASRRRQAGALSTAKSYPASEVRGGGREEEPGAEARDNGGREEQPHAPGQGGDEEEQPHTHGVVAVQAQEGLEEPFHVEGQEGQREEIPLIQGKEQRLCFAGAVVKRYLVPEVRETQVRW